MNETGRLRPRIAGAHSFACHTELPPSSQQLSHSRMRRRRIRISPGNWARDVNCSSDVQITAAAAGSPGTPPSLCSAVSKSPLPVATAAARARFPDHFSSHHHIIINIPMSGLIVSAAAADKGRASGWGVEKDLSTE